MTGIVIAAGRGIRMLPHTEDRPKCMLPVNGRPILAYALERLRAAGCGEIVIVTGHAAHHIDAPGCRLVHNDGYLTNNILQSLMYAREFFNDDLLVTYSDVVVEPGVYAELAGSTADFTLAVDGDWRHYYEGRTEHGVEEAEKAVVEPTNGSRGKLVAIGKHLDDSAPGGQILGEFTGLWKASAAGARRFRESFETLDRLLESAAPFQAAREWRKAYVTDLFSELLQQQEDIECLIIRRGWAELDSVQDYEALPGKLESQRLFSFFPTKVAPS